MESDEQRELRQTYRSNSTKYSKKDWKLFEEAFKLFEDGHDSNKKIAKVSYYLPFDN